MKIIDIKTPDELNLSYKKRIEEYCAENITKVSEPLKYQNYIPQSLDIEKHLYFSASFDSQDRLVCFCGIYNGGRYSPWVHRIQNRTFVAPEYRHKTFSIKPRFYTVELTNHQLNLWKKPELLFISIQEFKRTFRMLKYITSLIVPTPVQEWEVLNGYAKVAHGENAECYQKVIYANYGPHQLDFDLPTISDLEYESRFISNEPSKK